ncbi:MAG: Sapep family Mn(2+)-dependent dipeptidase [Erysipelotrichaceae bacterium]|nr:Sapep family Mn(2+)-dependent dipeptidase [Erysipelotrichaceae bacterium]
MDIKQFIDENLESMKADLADLVSFNSVYNDDEKPFGYENKRVLDCAIKQMEEKGLATKNLDYYCAYGQTGEGNETIGVLAHLDVVPAGDDWDHDPFSLTEEDGYLYGRGVSDDKGAAVASMYALKYLISEGYPFKKKVRLILGCNEETGSLCIKHYVEKEGHINYGFTPDANFPGIYAEKGVIGGKIIGHNTKIIDIWGGTVSNAVCAKVNAKLPNNSFDEDKLKAFLDKNKIRYEITKGETFDIEVFGNAAHASTPDLGVNAFSYLMEALYNAGFDDSFVKWFDKYFGLTLHGEILGFAEVQDEVTNTSINFGVVKKEGNDIIATLDMRFPVKSNIEACRKLIEKCEDNTRENEFAYEKGVEPLFYDKNLPMIKALKNAYENVTGDKETEMDAIGGGTYAKSIHNCIAYGCEFIGEDNHIHDDDERLSVDSFKKQVELYVEAIKNLNEI